MQEKIVTYVYDSKEVVLTGRIATPQAAKGKKSMMVEIVPLGAEDGDMSFARWVNMEDLYIVKTIEDEEFDDDET